jgi:hypothetical protein
MNNLAIVDYTKMTLENPQNKEFVKQKLVSFFSVQK